MRTLEKGTHRTLWRVQIAEGLRGRTNRNHGRDTLGARSRSNGEMSFNTSFNECAALGPIASGRPLFRPTKSKNKGMGAGRPASGKKLQRSKKRIKPISGRESKRYRILRAK